MELQRESHRQFEQTSRAKLVAFQNSRLAPSSKVFVPKTTATDLSITSNPPQKNKLKVESIVFKPSLTFKTKK